MYALNTAAPIIDAGESQEHGETRGLILQRSLEGVATSANGENIDFEWRQVSGPLAGLTTSETVGTFYLPPINFNVDIIYVFELVSRNTAIESRDLIVITFNNIDFPIITGVWISNDIVNEGDIFQLQGLVAYYAGDPVPDCQMRQTGASPYRINLSDDIQYTAPMVIEHTRLEFEYFCENSLGETGSATASLLVINLPETISVGIHNPYSSPKEGDGFQIHGWYHPEIGIPAPTCAMSQIDDTPYRVDLSSPPLTIKLLLSLKIRYLHLNSSARTASAKPDRPPHQCK